MPNDKGLLSKELSKIVENLLWEYGEQDTTRAQDAEGIVRAILTALSSQTDEELVEMIKVDLFHNYAHRSAEEQAKRLVYDIVTPIMAARVEVAVTKIANTYAKTIADLHKRLERAVASIEQARVEERKAIGRKLHDIYDSQPNSFPLVRKAIERLEAGEQPGGE